MADVGGGLGAFLSTWLVQTQHWTQQSIGVVLAAGLLAGMLLSTPAGALVDRVGHPRAMLAGACISVVLGTSALLFVEGFWPVLVAQVMVAGGGALGGPGLTALTLATVGKDKFPHQQGLNQAATHSGNLIAAAAIWVLTLSVGPSASIVVLAMMGAGMLVALALFRKGSVDHTRMHGCEKRGTMRNLLRNKKLLRLTLVLAAFNFGNGAVLPLLGQRMAVASPHDATQWLAILVLVAQGVMIPVSWLAGRAADRAGRRLLLIGACIALAVRGVLAIWSEATTMLIIVEVLDGIGAGLLSVAGPAAIADLTYGGGRTQTAMGGVQTVQSLASAGSALAGGYLVQSVGWSGTFGCLAVFPLIAISTLMVTQLSNDTTANQSSYN